MAPKRPTVGKVMLGITFLRKELWEIHRDHKPYQHKTVKLWNRWLNSLTGSKVMHQTGLLVWLSVWSKELELRNRMREFRSYGTVGEAPGNRCFYPESQRPHGRACFHINLYNIFKILQKSGKSLFIFLNCKCKVVKKSR